MKAYQIGLKGFCNSENEDEYDQSKNIWIQVPTVEYYKTVLAIEMFPFSSNITEVDRLPDNFCGKDSGIDYFLPEDLEKFLKHIADESTCYE